MAKTLGPCDKCGKPVRDGDARYIGGEPDKYRHATCHDWRSSKDIFAELRTKLNSVQNSAGRLRRQLNIKP